MNYVPTLASRYASHFMWTRPALPWSHSDVISDAVAQAGIDNIGIAGSLHPSIFISAVCEKNPEVKINLFAYVSCWQTMINSDEMTGEENDDKGHLKPEEMSPYCQICLPIPDRQINFWDGASPFFNSDGIFVDLPLSHRAMRVRLDSLRKDYSLLMLGFLESFAGPTDVYEWAIANGYDFEEHIAWVRNWESDEKLEYKLYIGTQRGLQKHAQAEVL